MDIQNILASSFRLYFAPLIGAIVAGDQKRSGMKGGSKANHESFSQFLHS